MCKPDGYFDPIMWFSQFKNEDWSWEGVTPLCSLLPEIQGTHFEGARANWYISGELSLDSCLGGVFLLGKSGGMYKVRSFQNIPVWVSQRVNREQ